MPETLSEYWPEGDAQVVQVFRKLVEVLKADPVLASMPITWKSWEGEARDASPPQVQELPWIRLTPITSPINLNTEESSLIEFRVKVEMVVAGTAWADIGNLSAHFRRALRYNRVYEGQTLQNVFRALKAASYEIIGAGTSAGRAERPVSEPSQPAVVDPVDQVAVGVVRFWVFEPVIN